MLRVKTLPALLQKAQQYRSAPRRACQCTDELSATPNGGGAAKGFTLWNSNQCSICDRHGLQTLSKISFYRVKTNLSSVTCHDPKLTKPLILLTLWLSQYRKSDSTFSSSESVAARSDCRRLGNTRCFYLNVRPAQAVPKCAPKNLAIDFAVKTFDCLLEQDSGDWSDCQRTGRGSNLDSNLKSAGVQLARVQLLHKREAA